MPTLSRRDGLIYVALLVLRLALALRGTAYIHPDEHFQGPEAALADQVQALRTWEFKSEYPARSMASVKLFNLPVVLVAWLGGGAASGGLLFATQRLTAFALSLVVDGCLAALLHHAPQRTRSAALLLYASSGATLTFAVRPFSNNVEAAVLCLCLVVVAKLHDEVEEWKPTQAAQPDRRRDLAAWSALSSLLGFLVALGLFSRFTFMVFAAPLGVYYLVLVWRLASRAVAVTDGQRSGLTRHPIVKSTLLLSDSINGLLFCSLAHVLYDTVYYRLQGSIDSSHSLSDTFQQGGIAALLSRLAHLSSWPLAIAPLNALRYNLQADNLALHGIHPRWLHAAVNAPMIVGSAVVWVACIVAGARLERLRLRRPARRASSTSASEEQPERFPLEMLSLCSIAVPLASLSAQPHQEPRFLLPLVGPAISLVVGGDDDGPAAPSSASTSPAPTRSSQRAEPAKDDAAEPRPRQRKQQRKAKVWPRRLFITLHLLQSAGMVLFFGIAHQGGVVPALVRIGEEVRSLQSSQSTTPSSGWLTEATLGTVVGETQVPVHVHVHFWRTFMPPRHLLALPLPSTVDAAAPGASAGPGIEVTVHDHSSSRRPEHLLSEMLRSHEEGLASFGEAQGDGGQQQQQHLLIAPSWAMNPFLFALPRLAPSGLSVSPPEGASNATELPPSAKQRCCYQPHVSRLASFAPHLDADHMGEMREVGLQAYKEARRRRGENDDEGAARRMATSARALLNAAHEALSLHVVRVSFDEEAPVSRPSHEGTGRRRRE